MRLSTLELERLAWLTESGHYLGALNFFKHLLRVNTKGLRAKYAGALERVEHHFHDAFRKSAWPSLWLPEKVAEHQRLVLWFIKEFGNAAPLIADINAVRAKGVKPRSLAYFLVADKGKRASRWDLLLGDKIQADWQTVKDEERRWADDHQSAIDNRQSTIDNPMHEMVIRSARADFQAAVKCLDEREATKIRKKIFALYRVDLAADPAAASPQVAADPPSPQLSGGEFKGGVPQVIPNS